MGGGGCQSKPIFEHPNLIQFRKSWIFRIRIQLNTIGMQVQSQLYLD